MLIFAYSNTSKVNWTTARLMTVAASVDDGVQPEVCGYAARRAREEHELDLPLGSDGRSRAGIKWKRRWNSQWR